MPTPTQTDLLAYQQLAQRELERFYAGTLPEQSQLNLVRALFFLSVESDAWLVKALAFADRMGSQKQAPASVQMYLLTLRAMQARTLTWPLQKYQQVNTVLQAMDHMVQTHSANLEIRFLRAAVAYNLPLVFNRQSQARMELRYLYRNLSYLQDLYPADLLDKIALFFFTTRGVLSLREMEELRRWQAGPHRQPLREQAA